MEDYDSNEVARIMRTKEYENGLIQTLIEGSVDGELIEEILECVSFASLEINLPAIARLATRKGTQVAFADQAEAAGEDLTADNPNNW